MMKYLPSKKEIDRHQDDKNTSDDEVSVLSSVPTDLRRDDDGYALSSDSHSVSSRSGVDDADNLYFAKAESQRVGRLRLTVFTVLFVVTTAVCLGVYFVVRQGQQEEFETAFEGSAAKVIQSMQDVFVERIGALTNFGVAMTSFALDTGSEWPFVTMNNFQQRAGSTRQLSGTIAMVMLPLVSQENLPAWGPYSIQNSGWVNETRHYQDAAGYPPELSTLQDTRIIPFLAQLDPGQGIRPAMECNPCAPAWQISPLGPNHPVNIDFLSLSLSIGGLDEEGELNSYETARLAAESSSVYLGKIETAPPGGLDSPVPETVVLAELLSLQAKQSVNYTGEAMSTVFIPVMDKLEEGRKAAAIMFSTFRWAFYFENILTDASQPVQIVLENACDGAFTYTIEGPHVSFDGLGNLAESSYEDMRISFEVDSSQVVFEKDLLDLGLQTSCGIELHVYPTTVGDDKFNDAFPMYITITIAAIFLFTVVVFILYDCTVERRQRKVLDTAKRSTAIVSSIFPRRVRDQLMAAPVQGNATKLRSLVHGPKRASNELIQQEMGKIGSTGPIADLFADATVMFADVEGFTAWSSIREPSQVFTLLETIYSAFDTIALRRKVFKVETVGDCYVAACGLPEPNKDHAVVMARFANECLEKFMAKTKELELVLGPGTGDLRLRVGLNSGPITAGVLRGERSRFQLFGDTVNTCSRIEASGKGGCTHLSEATANMIQNAGKGSWIRKRDGQVNMKGKGDMNTFWLENSLGKVEQAPVRRFVSFVDKDPKSRKERLVEWNATGLIKLIKEIVALRSTKRDATVFTSTRCPQITLLEKTPLEEVREIIELPQRRASTHRDHTKIKLDPRIEVLVHEYVFDLADLYQDNPFHNFEHASHVTMSVSKLLSRIVAPSDMNFSNSEDASKKLHDHTYGITSDPLTQFACVLAALIHDADHQGVPNTALVLEKDVLVQKYNGKSIAEQNSVDKAWDILMADRFKPLVATLCQDETELKRLRQLIVNAVMATDIMDPDLKTLRNKRWDTAFADTESLSSGSSSTNHNIKKNNINRKATIVIEHLIQASDVSHTMQHWSVYTKWNARLFKEMYKAYLDGRAGAKDPSAFWAKGEIGFFDFYIIPLAKKLKDCGVFGVSSDEFLNYAQANRKEWELKGQDIVDKLIQEVHAEYGPPPASSP